LSDSESGYREKDYFSKALEVIRGVKDENIWAMCSGHLSITKTIRHISLSIFRMQSGK